MLNEQLLPGGSTLLIDRLPATLQWDETEFNHAWELHPPDRHQVIMFGQACPVARWQQAYGADYRYTGSRNNAEPVPITLLPLLVWARAAADERLNGLLLNWYEGPQDYIGPHHDSRIGRVQDSPIVTISFGETRTFRLERGRGSERSVVDLIARDGTVFILPEATNWP